MTADQTPLDATVDYLLLCMSDADKAVFAQQPEDSPGAEWHHTLSRNIRNDLHLWDDDTPLTKWFAANDIYHGDDRSGTIFKAMWCKLNNKPFDIKAEAEFYRAYWAESGVNPDGTPLGGAV
jgi:hypothetical protein